MAKQDILVTNNTGSDILIGDLAAVVSAGEQRNLGDYSPISDVFQSEDLTTLIQSGDLTLNDGTSNLTADQADNFLKPASNKYYLQLIDSAGGTDCNAAPPGNAIPWGSQVVVDNIFSHSVSTNPDVITINRTGLYRITYNVCTDNQTNGRKTVRSYCFLNGTTTVPASVAYSYQRNLTDDRASNCSDFFVNLNASDTLQLFCEDRGSNGASDAVANESGINIEFIR